MSDWPAGTNSRIMSRTEAIGIAALHILLLLVAFGVFCIAVTQ